MAAIRSTHTLGRFISSQAPNASTNTVKRVRNLACTLCLLTVVACGGSTPNNDEPDAQAEAGEGGSGGRTTGGTGGKKPPSAGASAAGSGGRTEVGQGGKGGKGGSAAGAGGETTPDAGPDAGDAGDIDPVEPDAGDAGDPQAGTGGSEPNGEAGAGAGGAGAGGEPATEAGSGGAGAGGAGAGGAGTGGTGGQPPVVVPTGDLVYLSDTDKDADVILSADRLSGEWHDLDESGVRSNVGVAARSGVFYFEAYAPDINLFSIGVSPATAVLRNGPTSGGGFGVDVGGNYQGAGGSSQPFTRSARGEYGFVVDYRADSPTVYLIAGTRDAQRFVTSYTLSIGAPLFIHLSGLPRKQGYQAKINPGNDTTNAPFVFDPGTVLRGQGYNDVADALVLGWGGTHAGTFNQPPTLTLNPPSATQVNVGQSVTLTASASDAEGGVGDAQIVWDVKSFGIGPQHIGSTGGSFTFTPSVKGRHPIEVSVTDAGGKRATQQVTIEALGPLAQESSVRLTPEPAYTSSTIQVSSDGLRTKWGTNQKMAIRANQGLYGDFWYVEAHRLIPPDNQALGLVIGGTSLDPYPFNVAPPSCSINTEDGRPTAFYELMYANTTPVADNEYYGFAVDYRGTYPIAYAIANNTLIATIHMTDATVPIYPMLYGNTSRTPATPYDMEINFGATPFHENPAAALTTAGVNAAGLKLCWGGPSCF
jgi:hypothetical protein